MPVELKDLSDISPAFDGPALVGQLEWCQHIPRVHRALAAPSERIEYPSLPHSSNLFDYCAYWEPLYYLLRFSFGWTHLGKGMAWWYSHNKNSFDDSRLELIKQIWDTEGQLDLFAAWCWKNPQYATQAYSKKPEPIDYDPGKTWWLGIERNKHHQFDPYHGGENTLQLGHSESANSPVSQESTFIRTDSFLRKAVLDMDAMDGWYAELRHHGGTLPDLGNRSWHVDVFVKAVGFLGSYRKSRDTGLWFAGKHSLHMAGN